MTRHSFNYEQDFASINFREHPERYQVGRGEQGVLLIEPYKSEILPWWRYKDPESATKSAEKFISYSKPIGSKMILLAWIWPVNLYKWAIPEHGATPTIKEVKNMLRTVASTKEETIR